MCDCSLSQFVSENDGFILTFMGLVGSCCAAAGFTVIRSRCTTISMLCGCLSCERSVLSEQAVVARERDAPATAGPGAV